MIIERKAERKNPVFCAVAAPRILRCRRSAPPRRMWRFFVRTKKRKAFFCARAQKGRAAASPREKKKKRKKEAEERRVQRAAGIGIGIGIGVAIGIAIAIEFVTGRFLFYHEGHEGHEVKRRKKRPRAAEETPRG